MFTDNMEFPRHRWYEFKEGFSALLVQEAIAQARPAGRGRPMLVVDPFSGSGTTILTAAISGHRAIGIEVNPFLAFAAEAKARSTPWRRSAFEEARDLLLSSRLEDGETPLETISTFTERPGLSKWLFNRSVLRACVSSQRAINRIPPEFTQPLRLALLAAALDCSNAKRDGKCLRYKKNWNALNLDDESFRTAFHRRSEIMFEDAMRQPLNTQLPPEVVVGDSRDVLDRLGANGEVDLVVTSPPYLNSFDYSDVYRPEMFLGGFVQDNAELRRVRLQTVRSHVQVAWEPTARYRSPLLDSYVSRLRAAQDLWDPRLPDMVQAYFDDMKSVLEKVSALLKPGGQAWFVVSTSAYAGVEIPVDLLLAEVGEASGLRLEAVHVLRPLRSSGQHWQGHGTKPPLRESLVIWRKPGRR